MRNLLVTAAVFGVGGYFGAKFYVQHKAAQDLDSMLAQMRPVVDIGYRKVVATMNGELRVEGVTVRFPRFDDSLTVESVNVLTPGFLFLLGFDDDARGREFPERLGVELEGLRARVDADFMRALENYRAMQPVEAELTPADVCASTRGFTAATLQQLGYHEIAADFSASFHRLAGEITVNVGAKVEHMYEFDLELTLGGISDPTAVVRGARPLLVGGRIDYTDRSLNGRIMQHCAEQQVTAEDVIAAQLREVQTLALASGMELDALILQPYTDFLLGKQRFTVTSEPTKPVDLTRISLYKPSDVPNLLNLRAEAG